MTFRQVKKLAVALALAFSSPLVLCGLASAEPAGSGEPGLAGLPRTREPELSDRELDELLLISNEDYRRARGRQQAGFLVMGIGGGLGTAVLAAGLIMLASPQECDGLGCLGHAVTSMSLMIGGGVGAAVSLIVGGAIAISGGVRAAELRKQERAAELRKQARAWLPQQFGFSAQASFCGVQLGWRF